MVSKTSASDIIENFCSSKEIRMPKPFVAANFLTYATFASARKVRTVFIYGEILFLVFSRGAIYSQRIDNFFLLCLHCYLIIPSLHSWHGYTTSRKTAINICFLDIEAFRVPWCVVVQIHRRTHPLNWRFFCT